jgi:hypothetical protein
MCWFFFLILSGVISASEVLIFTYSYNRPDFIETQNACLQKFVKDDYRFVVFNDATDPQLEEEINRTCAKLNIQCIKIPQALHKGSTSPSERNGNVVDYSLRVLGYHHKGILVLLDSDIFIVKDLSFNDLLKDKEIFALMQQRESMEYFWIGLVAMKMNHLPEIYTISFRTANIDSVQLDAGGASHYYLRSHRNRINVIVSNCFYTMTPDPRMKTYFPESEVALLMQIPNSELYHDGHFFHYRGATNWDGRTSEFHRRKTELVSEFINLRLNSK